MNSEVRVGDVVYDCHKKILAVFSHGSWCHRRKTRSGEELVPVDDAVSKKYAQIPDSLVISMGEFDKQIVSVAKDTIGALRGASSQKKKLIEDAIYDGVSRGLKKFGPFDPGGEARNLNDSIQKSLVNAMVYCCMKMMIIPKGDPGHGDLKDTFVRCADCWMRMRGG